MDLPAAKLRQEYVDEIKVIEANVKDIANGNAPQELYEYSQNKLDKLAERFQYDKHLGTARYKLYELQALLYYFQNRDDDALAFIQQAIEAKGASYKRAEQLIQQVQAAPSTQSQHSLSRHNMAANHELPLQLQAYIKGLRTAAIIMAVISAVSIYFIPWAVFYIILAMKLKPTELPNRKLIKGAAIATLPLCLGVMPILIDVEFWKMNKHLRKYEDQGSEAFISNDEFLKGEPKRKKRNIITWSILGAIVVIFIILVVVAIVSSNSDSGAAGTVNTDSSGSALQDAKQRMESLRNQYDTCSGDLNARRDRVNTESDYEVDSFNSDLQDCETTRLKLNSTVDEYNRLAGFN